jgi:septum formation topological specificity factor MinE
MHYTNALSLHPPERSPTSSDQRERLQPLLAAARTRVKGRTLEVPEAQSATPCPPERPPTPSDQRERLQPLLAVARARVKGRTLEICFMTRV